MEEDKKQIDQDKARLIRNSIKTIIVPISEAPDELIELFISEYDLDDLTAKKIVDENLIPYFGYLIESLYVVIETPYVDKLYRDSFYIFYASKHFRHFRDTIRLSFFKQGVSEPEFYDRKNFETKLLPNYLGFLVIRPTFPKIFSRTAISPDAFRVNNFAYCCTNLDATVLSNKFTVLAFPHSSQDGLTITCAETTIWGILEYFSHQYADYKPVLPSTISQINRKISFKRAFPSEGLTAEQVTYAIRELGFGAMIYSRKKYSGSFNGIVSMYIESGIPVIGVLKDANGKIGHAVNIVGRELQNTSSLVKESPLINTPKGGQLIDFNSVDRKYVFMDDNLPPYQLAPLNYPCQHYYVAEAAEKEKWDEVNLTHIIVPLYSKIYLDAVKARENFIKVLNSDGLGKKMSINITDKRVLRVFLASSRSFKQYVTLDSGLSQDAKLVIQATPMPKFVWLAEISTLSAFERGQCDGILVQDATDPGDYTGKGSPLVHSLILGIYENDIFRLDYGRFTFFRGTFAGSFNTYRQNFNSIKNGEIHQFI